MKMLERKRNPKLSTPSEPKASSSSKIYVLTVVDHFAYIGPHPKHKVAHIRRRTAQHQYQQQHLNQIQLESQLSEFKSLGKWLLHFFEHI